MFPQVMVPCILPLVSYLENLLSCRYDDLDEVQADDNGITVLHMTCGNGHIVLIHVRHLADVLEYLLPLVSPSILSAQNSAGSTTLHWAALNQHLEGTQKLVRFTGGSGVDLNQNIAGRSPIGEAEMIGWVEGARWLVQEMKLDETSQHDVNDSEEDGPVDTTQGVEVEIQDADGAVAKMTISGGAAT
ncbi:cytoplasmic protein [Suillus occidentalis]|nr:cytoplasmic protein [Suillus occidentalis]